MYHFEYFCTRFPANISCSKLTIETQEEGVNYVQSYK